MKIMAVSLLCVTVFMISCGIDSPLSEASNSQSAPLVATGTAKSLEYSWRCRYDSAGIRRSVDNALNLNDARNAETKKRIDQTNGK